MFDKLRKEYGTVPITGDAQPSLKLQVLPSLIMSISKNDGDTTAPLGNHFQCLITLTVNNVPVLFQRLSSGKEVITAAIRAYWELAILRDCSGVTVFAYG